MNVFSFDCQDAAKYGVNEAIILFHLRYWVVKNATTGEHFHNGKFWLYDSATSLNKLFPFFSVDQCKRLVSSLEKQGAIISGRFNKKAWDRTKWFTLADPPPIVQNCAMHCAKLPDGVPQGFEGGGKAQAVEITHRAKSPYATGKTARPIPITHYNELNTNTTSHASGEAAPTKVDALPVKSVENLIPHYCEEYKKRYGINPPIMGKSSGIAKRLVKDLGLERAKRLVTAYLGMSESWFLTKGHDLFTFEQNITKINEFMERSQGRLTAKMIADLKLLED
jgi:hypothetical protein